MCCTRSAMLPNGEERVLAYDAFAARVITQTQLPWGDRTVEEWADDHDTRACERGCRSREYQRRPGWWVAAFRP